MKNAKKGATRHSTQLSYMSLEWDKMDHEKREFIALEQAKTTALFAKQSVPFYNRHFEDISEKAIANISTLEEFAVLLPETTKDHLSKNAFREFIPHVHPGTLFKNKGTGGTTGRPVTIMYSNDDWRAMSQHIARSVKFDWRDRLEQIRRMKILGLYHGDHITNDIYAAGMALLGAQFFGRPSTSSDPSALYDFIQELRPNLILAPPADAHGKQTKGLALDMILHIDATKTNADSFRLNHGINPEFHGILWSSMPISEGLLAYAHESLEVPYIQGQYGSTEICPTGATCSKYQRDFHVGYGPSLMLVRHPNEKRLVNEEEEGIVLVSRTGATQNDGVNTIPTGTVLLNFNSGDQARLINQNGKECVCGRNTPILLQVRRVQNIQAKAAFGCQVD